MLDAFSSRQHLDLIIEPGLTAGQLLYYHARIRWNAAMAAATLKVPGHQDRSGHGFFGSLAASHELILLVTNLLQELGLLEHANTPAGKMSGGQQRRLAIATECVFEQPNNPAACAFLPLPSHIALVFGAKVPAAGASHAAG